MSSLWLANAEPVTAWSHETWSDLSARPDKARTLVIIPVHGFADHGMGLPLNTEEVVGGAVLRSATTAARLHPHALVLPPVRFGAAPYPHTHFGVDIETALEALNEIASSVKASGFSRILFFNTSPWNNELVATAALDLRAALGLRTYVISSTGIGLGFHPTDPNRGRTQAAAARLLGRPPAVTAAAQDVRDAHFRPGHFAQPAFVAIDPARDGNAIFIETATKLARLLIEVVAHETTLDLPPEPIAVEVPKPVAAQPRELVSLTAEQLAGIPNKERALIILPTGAVEQHGHHLPLGTDAMLGALWLQHTLPKLGAHAPVYLAPALVYGKSNEHLGFAGTLTISARTLRKQLLALASHLKALGFRQLAVLNTHGGNSATLVPVLREIQTSLGLRAGMLGGHYRPNQSPQEAAYGFHAGEWETSLMLAGMPGLVRMDRAVREYPACIDDPGTLKLEGSPAVFAWKTSDVSQSGVIGDATLANAEKGARWLEEASTALARRIKELLG